MASRFADDGSGEVGPASLENRDDDPFGAFCRDGRVDFDFHGVSVDGVEEGVFRDEDIGACIVFDEAESFGVDADRPRDEGGASREAIFAFIQKEFAFGDEFV